MERYWAVQARLRKIEEKGELVAATDAARAKIILNRGKVLRAAAKRIIRTVGAGLLIEDAELLLEGYCALEEGRWEEYAKKTEAQWAEIQRLIDDHWAEYVQKEKQAKAKTQSEARAGASGSRTSGEGLQLEAQDPAAQHMEGQPGVQPEVQQEFSRTSDDD